MCRIARPRPTPTDDHPAVRRHTDGVEQLSGRVVVRGTISSAGFRSGDRFVVGHWPASPIGPMHDVMWATPDDRRILLAPTQPVAAFITSIYDFDEVRIGPLDVIADGRRTQVDGHGLELDLRGGRRWPLPLPSRRPLRFTRSVEAPIARRLMGVETYGVSPVGATEWYQATGVRWVVDGSGRVHGVDIGSPGRVDRPVRVGFSEPPARPSIVAVRVTIDLADRQLVPGTDRPSGIMGGMRS